jgi:hypothetical protein
MFHPTTIPGDQLRVGRLAEFYLVAAQFAIGDDPEVDIARQIEVADRQ